MRKSRLIASGVAVALLAAACQSAPTPTAGVVPVQPDAADLQPATEAPESVGDATAQIPPTDPTTAPIEPAAPVVVRQALAATDPASVDLASGTPSLVEFFAFW